MEVFLVVVRDLSMYWILHLFLSSYLERRCIRVSMGWVGAIAYVFAFTFLLGVNENLYFNAARTYIGFFIIAVLYYKERAFKLGVFTLIFHFIGLMSDLLVGAIITVIAHMYIAEIALNPQLQTIGSLVANTVILIFVLLFRKLFRGKHYNDSLKDLFFMSSFLTASAITMLMMFRLLAVAAMPVAEHIGILFLMPILLFTSIILFFQYDSAVKSKELEMELAVTKEMENNRQILIEQHEKNIDEKNTIIHDYKNSILHLTGIITQEDALAFCNDLIEGYSKQLVSYKYNVNNDILSTILGKLKHDCEQNDICLDIQILHGDFSFIKPVDTSSLFGNAFDNAIAACIALPQNRRISVIIAKMNNFAYVTVTNTKCNEVVVKDGELLSTKRKYFKKGYGVSRIKSIAMKYGGNVHIDHRETEFSCKIWLNSLS